MAYKIGFVDNASVLAHYAMLGAIKDFLESDAALVAAGQQWQVLRYETVSANRELILKGTGLSGTEEIFIGFRTYQSVSADYYNLVVGVFTGYVPGNSFDTQPGAMISGVPAHNQRIDYWMTANGQRIAMGLKVGTPVYEHAYAGKYFPYAAPGEYRAPLVCGGMLNGVPATRFSEATHSMPYKGNRANMRQRSNAGAWLQPECYPFNNTLLCGTAVNDTQVRPTGSQYFPLRIELTDAGSVYGSLDGVYYIPGFDNATENVLQMGGSGVVDQAGKTVTQIVEEILGVDGRAFVVLQDVGRTGFSDYIAMEMS